MPCSNFFGNQPWVLSDGPIFSKATSAAFAGRILSPMPTMRPSTRSSQFSLSVAPGWTGLPWAATMCIAVRASAVVFLSSRE